MERNEVEKVLAEEALGLQNACNPSGVANSLYNATCRLNGLDLGTRGVTEHPVTVLMVDKLASLCGVQDWGNEKVVRAHEACRVMAGASAP